MMGITRRFMIFVLIIMLIVSGIPVSYASSHSATVPPIDENVLFSDVPAGQANALFIEYLAKRGILNGFPDQTFRPNIGLTRAEAAVIISRVSGLTTGKGASFKDVPASHWAAKSISAAQQAGLLHGFPDGSFRPNAKLTRAQGIAVLLCLRKQSASGAVLTGLVDVSQKHWAADYIAEGLAAEMMGLSTDQKHFYPERPFNRGDLARALAILMTREMELAAAELPLELSVRTGTVSVFAKGQEEPTIVKDRTELKLGDMVETQSGAEAELVLPDGSGLLIKENSRYIVKEAEGRSYIKHDGTPGVAVEWLALELKHGKIFGALATRYNSKGAVESQDITENVSEVEMLSGPTLSTSKLTLAINKKKAAPWWKTAKVKRTRVKVDMPWGVASVQGTFWKNALAQNSSSSHSVLVGESIISAGDKSVTLGSGNRCTIEGQGQEPADPVPMNFFDKRDWQENMDWVRQRARQIDANREAFIPAPVPVDAPVPIDGSTGGTDPGDPLDGQADNVIDLVDKELDELAQSSSSDGGGSSGGSGGSGGSGDDIIYNPFMGPIQASHTDIFADEESTVTFRVIVKDNNQTGDSPITLQRMDSGNEAGQILTTLNDDGNLDSGDDVAGDGIFSGTVNFHETSPGEMNLVATLGEVISQSLTLTVLPNVSDDLITADLHMTTEIQSQFDVFSEVYNQDLALQRTYSWLTEQQNVAEHGLSGSCIWYKMSSGIGGMVVLDPIDQVYGGGTDVSAASAYQTETSSSIPSSVYSSNVLIARPFEQYLGYNFANNPYDAIRGSITNAAFKVELLDDYNAGVDVFKKLSKYGMIVLVTHGGMFEDKSVLASGTPVPSVFDGTFKADLLSGRLIAGSLRYQDMDLNYYFITPEFIKFYNQSFPNSLVYTSASYGLTNSSMANAFLAKGAKTFFGYDNEVNIFYDAAIAPNLFTALLQGNTTAEAYNSAYIQQSDDIWSESASNTPAFLKMAGASDLTLDNYQIINGSFETGNLAGWGSAGDVRVIPSMGTILPTEGSLMAIISTGLGAEDESDSSISQRFIIPEGVQIIAFDYNVISEEPEEFIESEFDDKFEAVLYQFENKLILAQESINSSTWQPISGIDFSGGDDTTYETGWQHVTYDVSQLEGPLLIEFHTWDKGDSDYDTAVLLDNIKFQ